jgi:hypothetical protein
MASATATATSTPLFGSRNNTNDGSGHRDGIKVVDYTARSRQREERLEGQRNARREMTLHARTLVQRGISFDDTKTSAPTTIPSTSITTASNVTIPTIVPSSTASSESSSTSSLPSSNDDSPVALDERSDDTNSTATTSKRWRESNASRIARYYYAKQLMLPTWLAHIPHDLADEVCPYHPGLSAMCSVHPFDMAHSGTLCLDQKALDAW